MLTRSLGECGASICGPNETMSRPGTLLPITAVSSQACTAVTLGGLAEESLVDSAAGCEGRRIEVGRPAGVFLFDGERAPGEPGSGIERFDHLG